MTLECCRHGLVPPLRACFISKVRRFTQVISVGSTANELHRTSAPSEQITALIYAQISPHNWFTSESGSPQKWTVKAQGGVSFLPLLLLFFCTIAAFVSVSSLA